MAHTKIPKNTCDLENLEIYIVNGTINENIWESGKQAAI